MKRALTILVVTMFVVGLLVSAISCTKTVYVTVTPSPTLAATPPPSPTPTPMATYNVYVSADPPYGGMVIGLGNRSSFPYGTTLELVEVPATGYRFFSWSGDVTGKYYTITVSVDSNLNIVANFALMQYTVTTDLFPPYGGTISPYMPTVTYGATVTFTATPSHGYQFVSWSGAVRGTNPSVTLIVDSNTEVGANFEPIPSPTPTLSPPPPTLPP